MQEHDAEQDADEAAAATEDEGAAEHYRGDGGQGVGEAGCGVGLGAEVGGELVGGDRDSRS